MARPRTVPDDQVYEAVLALIRAGGEKAVTFAAVSDRIPLAPSTLAERYGGVTTMIAEARAFLWTRLEAETARALGSAPLSPKGAIAVLKALPDPSDLDIQGFPARALAWRQMVETSLAARLGGAEEGRVAASILFGVWLGEAPWRAVGHRSTRLKAVLRALR